MQQSRIVRNRIAGINRGRSGGSRAGNVLNHHESRPAARWSLSRDSWEPSPNCDVSEVLRVSASSSPAIPDGSSGSA
jgi:hypothetical protein